jgi:predicted branched-subunit amino acid permease
VGIERYSAYLSVALGALAAALLGLGLWPLAALALAFLVGGRREPVTLTADAIVFVGLAGHADPLWVALLVIASLAAREHDPRAILVLLLASLAATFVYVDWTILTGMLAALRIASLATRAVRRREVS